MESSPIEQIGPIVNQALGLMSNKPGSTGSGVGPCQLYSREGERGKKGEGESCYCSSIPSDFSTKSWTNNFFLPRCLRLCLFAFRHILAGKNFVCSKNFSPSHFSFCYQEKVFWEPKLLSFSGTKNKQMTARFFLGFGRFFSNCCFLSIHALNVQKILQKMK